MRYLPLIFLLFATLTEGMAQNLVPNCSFESYYNCPTNPSQIQYCNQWRRYTSSTPDYFNACVPSPFIMGVPSNNFGYEPAAHGNAYAGLVDYSNSDYREYIAVTIPALTIKAAYEVSMSVSLADNSGCASNGLGAWFFANGSSTITTPFSYVIPATPQVSYTNYGVLANKTGWTRLSGIFIADSAYTNLVIGGFLNNAQITTVPPYAGYAYYYIDSVVVKELSIININFSGTPMCAGDTFYVPYTVTLNTLFQPGNIFTLQLSDPAGSFASPLNIGSVTATATGTIMGVLPPSLPGGTGYRVRIISSNPAYISADNGSDIFITPFPTVTATANTPICEGSALNLMATSLPGAGYSWTGPSFTSTLQNATIGSASVTNTGDYIVTATLNGCEAKDTVTVLVKPTPALPTVVNNGPLCEGGILNLGASSNMGTYNWTGPAFASNQQNPQIANATVANSGVYTVTASLNGCTSAPISTTVTVKLMPAVPTAASNSPVCTGGILNLSANSSTPGIVYDWTGPAGFASTQQNPVINPVPANAGGNYNVTASLNGCTSQPGTVTAVVNTITYLGAYASPNDTICAGDTLTVVTVPVNGGSTPAFQWYKNNAEIPGATLLKYVTLSAITGDTFYCRMIAGNVCNTPITLFSNKIGITILPATPAPSVSISSVPAAPLPGNMATFNANITNGGANAQVQWLRNGQAIAGATAATWSTINLYPYDTISVRVTSSDPCPEMAVAVSNRIGINFPTSIKEQQVNGFSVYPNPNKGTFTIAGNAGEGVRMEIVTLAGQIVYSRDALPENGRIHCSISPATALATGVYLLRITGSNSTEIVKLVVE